MTTDTLAHRLAQLGDEARAILADPKIPRVEKEKRMGEIKEKEVEILALRKKANAQKVNGISPMEQESRRLS